MDTQDYLKYADLQMAAEAFLNDGLTTAYVGDALQAALIRGNGHASRFTAAQAGHFKDHWVALDQEENTVDGTPAALPQTRLQALMIWTAAERIQSIRDERAYALT